MVRKIRIAIILLSLTLSCALTTGCWDSVPVEKRAIVLAMGIDYIAEKQEYEVTLVYPLTQETRARFSDVVSLRGHSVAEALGSWHHTSNAVLSLAAITVIVYGHETASRGVIDTIHDLYGFPDLRSAAQVILAPATAKELLSVVPPETQLISVYLKDVIQRGHTQGDFPPTILANFVMDIVTPGVDPLVGIIGPIGKLSVEEDEKSSASALNQGQGENSQISGGSQANAKVEDVQVLGAGLWSLDRQVGTIDLIRLQHLLLISGGQLYMPLHLVIPGDGLFTGDTDHIGLVIEDTAHKWELSNLDGLHYKLTIGIRLSLNSYQGISEITADDNIEVLEVMLSEAFSQGIQSTLEEISASGSDPLGLGQRFRVKFPRKWQPEQWRDVLKTVTFEVKAEVRITNVGIHIYRLKPR